MRSRLFALAGLIGMAPAHALCDMSGYETRHDETGEYTRFPPGSHYERKTYGYSLVIPDGVEGCTDGGIMGGHGLSLGDRADDCKTEGRQPAATLYAFWRDPIDFGGLSNLIRDLCAGTPVARTGFVVDGRRFRRCARRSPELGRFVSYFAYRPGEALEVTIFCPAIGSCRKIEKRWARAIFKTLQLDWP